MTNRRDFIKYSGMGVLAATMPDLYFPKTFASGYGLSVQLYTIRDQIKTDIQGSLKKLAAVGFKHVETAFWPDTITVQRASDYLKEAGLSVSSSHVDIPTRENITVIANNAKLYNCHKIIWHGWPEDKRYSSLMGTKELANLYNEGYKIAKDHGLDFGLHNHWWEYRNQVGGKRVYEVLNEELDENIFFETDVYWVKVAGQDPAAIIKKLKRRIRMLHMKDGPAVWNENLPVDNPDPMTPVGQGTLNIPAIIDACTDQVQWLVVELDKSAINVYDALQQSVGYLSKFKSINLK